MCGMTVGLSDSSSRTSSFLTFTKLTSFIDHDPHANMRLKPCSG
jgi:hypothetical protein